MSTCILTTKDISIIEVMLERNPDKLSPLARLMRAKADGAQIVFREDVPETVATLNSRVSYRVNGGEPDTRIVSQSAMNASVGHFLPVTTMRGLALLGMMQGQTITVPGRDGADESIELLEVLHQPEAAQRRMTAAPETRRPAPFLTLVSGGKTGANAPAPGRLAMAGFDDDPGPSAA